MIRHTLTILALLILARPAQAQQSDAADKRAGSWFHNVRETFLKRTSGLQAADLDLWEAAGTKAMGTTKRGDLFLALPKFNPLWNKSDQPVAGAVAKYAKRLEQIPGKSVENWQTLTGAEPLHAAMSLTAENDLFPQEQFSDKAFQAFVAKYK